MKVSEKKSDGMPVGHLCFWLKSRSKNKVQEEYRSSVSTWWHKIDVKKSLNQKSHAVQINNYNWLLSHKSYVLYMADCFALFSLLVGVQWHIKAILTRDLLKANNLLNTYKCAVNKSLAFCVIKFSPRLCRFRAIWPL